jgi:predicted DsbA family dithiol-disulfide isomerase
LKSFAVELGLDTTAFNACMDDGKYTEEIQQMSQVARQIGVQSTPSFAINGQALVGAQPFDVFQQVIEGYLQGQ